MNNTAGQPTIRKQVEDALFNYPVKEVRHEHGSLILVLNGGREIHITADHDYIAETTTLDVDLYVIERKRVGGYEV